MQKITPMMEQYLEIKKNHKDAILFFRLGDFYEMFFEDAIIASKILDITLTGKSYGQKERAPMCGVPYHSADGYIQKLILAGKKVAICEQMENPADVKGIVKREVVRIITPGTVLDDNIIPRDRNNYLMSVDFFTSISESIQEIFQISYIDVSTGDIQEQTTSSDDFSNLFYKVSPVEMILTTAAKERLSDDKTKNSQYFLNQVQEKNIFINVLDMKELDFTDLVVPPNSMLTTKLLYYYIAKTQKSAQIKISLENSLTHHMELDQFTLKNLELTETIREGRKKGSLLWVLDNTKTPMGARTIKKWIEYPLIESDAINKRLNLVEAFYSRPSMLKSMEELLDKIHDIERICTRLSYGTSTHQDLIKLKNSIKQSPLFKEILNQSKEKNLMNISDSLQSFDDIYQLLNQSIQESDIYKSKNMHIIKDGYDKELDHLRNVIQNANEIILEIEQKEKIATGIKGLKIGYNKIFGYYIEITKASLKNIENLPTEYIRKQTLVSSERYINEDLKKIEAEILTAKEQSEILEQNLYNQIKEKLQERVDDFLLFAKIIGELDGIYSFGKAAIKNNYIKPQISLNGQIDIKQGRHPVIEKIISQENFVPNDTNMSQNDIHILTGPNMAGKSTYMRQVALIVLMTHMGSFVPCEFANINLVDRVYTRVGASDDLSQGQSTFMVEMTEVSNILKKATDKSLIILDEIGRGTSTYDGMSIAYSVIEFIQSKIRAKSFVSTHYHEITALEEKFNNIYNYSMAVEDENEDVIFLRKVISGKSDKSYGIHVAKLANLPQDIIEKSYRILERLEKDHTITLRESFGEIEFKNQETEQLSYENILQEEIIDEIKKIDINSVTPMESLNFLFSLKSRLK